MLRAIVVLVVLLGLLAAAVPTGSAQIVPSFYPVVSIHASSAPQDPIAPGGTDHAILNVWVQCRIQTQPGPIVEGFAQPRFRIVHQVRADQPWIQALIDPITHDVEFGPDECLNGGERRYPLQVTLSVVHGAPAFSKARVDVQARGPAGDVAVASLQVTAGFAGPYSARPVDGTITLEPGTSTELGLDVINDANGPIQVTVAPAEDSDREVMVVLPGAQIVGSLVSGAESHRVTMTIDAQTDAAAGHTGVILLVVSANSADDRSISLDPQQVSYVFEVVGDAAVEDAEDPLPEELPAPNMVLPGLVVFGLAAFLRRRII